MLKNIIWYTVMTISIIGIIILSIGFYKAISLTSGANTSTQISNDTIDNQVSNNPTDKTSNSIILIIMRIHLKDLRLLILECLLVTITFPSLPMIFTS